MHQESLILKNCLFLIPYKTIMKRKGYMKKIVSVLMIFSLMALSGCYEKSENNEISDTYFYNGESSSWFATYSITEDKSSYYDSLTIQYLFDEDGDDQTDIGPIEYQLNGNSIETKSSYPQELQGVANFHTGTRMNADMFEITFDEEMELLVKWQDKNETIKLQRHN